MTQLPASAVVEYMIWMTNNYIMLINCPWKLINSIWSFVVRRRYKHNELFSQKINMNLKSSHTFFMPDLLELNIKINIGHNIHFASTYTWPWLLLRFLLVVKMGNFSSSYFTTLFQSSTLGVLIFLLFWLAYKSQEFFLESRESSQLLWVYSTIYSIIDMVLLIL